MSVIISSGEQINRSPLNTSPSKHRFSFSKALRFRAPKPANTGVVGYNLPSTLHTRGTSLGYGSRQKIINLSTSPPPNAYQLRGAFQDCLKKKKGFTFGASRISFDKVFIKDSPYKDPCSPGPGEYSGARPRFGANANSFTMRPRTSVQYWRPGRDSPGPCGYKLVEGISATGKYPITKYHNYGSFIISGKDGRFAKQIKNPAPGPGQYHPKDSLDPQGAYFVSKFRSTQTRSFSKAERSVGRRSSTSIMTPGPGSYRLPSDFGHYESRFTNTQTPTSPLNVKASKSTSNFQKSISQSTNATYNNNSNRLNTTVGASRRAPLITEEQEVVRMDLSPEKQVNLN